MDTQYQSRKLQYLVQIKLSIAKIISYITVAPVMSFCTMTALYFIDKNHFQHQPHYFLAVLYLTIVPLLAYPLQKLLPKYRELGRDGQRDFAFVMVLVGYSLGLLNAIILKAPMPYMMVYLGYFISGIILTITNKVFKIKASGHACGVMGPIILFIFFLGKYSAFLLLLLPIVFWSRLKLHRHSFFELLSGASVSFFSTVLSILLFTFHFGI